MNRSLITVAFCLADLPGCKREAGEYECSLGLCHDRQGRIVDPLELIPETPEQISQLMHYGKMTSDEPGSDEKIEVRVSREGEERGWIIYTNGSSDAQECYSRKKNDGAFVYLMSGYGGKTMAGGSRLTVRPDGRATYPATSGWPGEPDTTVMHHSGTCTIRSDG